MFYFQPDPKSDQPLQFLVNLSGNNGSDVTGSYVPNGSLKSFSVQVAGGVPPYTFAWFRRSGGVDNSVGTNSSTYSIPAYSSSNNGDYFCRVTDAQGVMIESLRERTKVLIRLTTNLPLTDAWAVGVSDSLAIVVSDGLTPYTYQWQKSTDGGATWSNVANGGTVSGATTATLTNSAPALGDAGMYRCIVTDSAGYKVQSVQCAVTVA